MRKPNPIFDAILAAVRDTRVDGRPRVDDEPKRIWLYKCDNYDEFEIVQQPELGLYELVVKRVGDDTDKTWRVSVNMMLRSQILKKFSSPEELVGARILVEPGPRPLQKRWWISDLL